ncbi:hypothetical protein MRX96_022560 [Rhipicephalus microplus]
MCAEDSILDEVARDLDGRRARPANRFDHGARACAPNARLEGCRPAFSHSPRDTTREGLPPYTRPSPLGTGGRSSNLLCASGLAGGAAPNVFDVDSAGPDAPRPPAPTHLLLPSCCCFFLRVDVRSPFTGLPTTMCRRAR